MKLIKTISSVGSYLLLAMFFISCSGENSNSPKNEEQIITSEELEDNPSAPIVSDTDTTEPEVLTMPGSVHITGVLTQALSSDPENDAAPMGYAGYTVRYLPDSTTKQTAHTSRSFATGRIMTAVSIQENNATTDSFGSYELEVDSSPSIKTFEVLDESGSSVGSFSIQTDEDGTLDLSYGMEQTGSTFSASVPLLDFDESVSFGSVTTVFSTIPAEATTSQQTILQVIHQKALELLYKNANALTVNGTTDLFQSILSGSDGGGAELSIVIDETASGQVYVPSTPGTAFPWSGSPAQGGSDPLASTSHSEIIKEKLYIIKFNDFNESGVIVNGTIAFMYGFEPSSSATYPGWIFNTDADAWGMSTGYWGDVSKMQEVIDYFAYRSQPHILSGKEAVADLLADMRSWYTYPETELPAGSSWQSPNHLTISGALNDTVDVSFSVLNQETAPDILGIDSSEAEATYHWNDTLRFTYTFGTGGSITMEEKTGPGIYKKTYSELMAQFDALPKTSGDSQSYMVEGPQGGSVVFSMEKESTATGKNVLETRTFQHYGANDIFLDGTIQFLYKTDNDGGFIEAASAAGTVNISGYFSQKARHKLIIWHNGTNFQLTDWYFVGDYPVGWDRACVLLGVSVN